MPDELRFVFIKSSGDPSENFHGVSIGPVSKILAVKEEGWKKVLLLLPKVNSITANHKLFLTFLRNSLALCFVNLIFYTTI